MNFGIISLLVLCIGNKGLRRVEGADDTVRTSEIAVLDKRARLPCDVRSSLPQDRPVLILWYKNAAGTPIYSFDARGIKLEDGKHWSDTQLIGERAYFKFSPSKRGSSFATPSTPLRSFSDVSNSGLQSLPIAEGAYLELSPVFEDDEGIYRCRVDFLLSPTRNTLVEFSVIIPPNSPIIYNVSEEVVGGVDGPSIIGPYDEGEPLRLFCKVTGGRPTPVVRWFMNGAQQLSERSKISGDVVSASLEIHRLTRKHLHAVFECRASNFNKSVPISSTVTLDMNFEPSNVYIQNREIILSDNSDYELMCESWGSRPPATITWFKGGSKRLPDTELATSHDGNVTTSVLHYKAKMADNQKYLLCRAENPHIPASAKEDGMQLNIHYKPVVTLQMGSKLDPSTIKESDDAYFECHINANPKVEKTTWSHNGLLIPDHTNKGILFQNQTLVLQKIDRTAAGLYTCSAYNSEGASESNAVSLNVLFRPYCRSQNQSIYGTALDEPATVACEVEAKPEPVKFSWTFNNTSEHLPIDSSDVTSKGLFSVAKYAPHSHLDYGTLLCWARNSIGAQRSPCAFAIIPAGPPDPPKNCSIVNRTSEAIQVECDPGFNGGLPQTFYMEVYDSSSKTLYGNLTSESPNFLLHSLKPGLALVMVPYAANSKGRSKAPSLESFTLKVAEKRTSPPSILEMTPVVGLIIGVVSVLLLTALVVILAMKLRGPHDEAARPRDLMNEMLGALGEDKTVARGVGGETLSRYKEETPHRDSATAETEEANPDIIPQEKAGQRK